MGIPQENTGHPRLYLVCPRIGPGLGPEGLAPAFFREIDHWQLPSSHQQGVIVDPALVQLISIVDVVCNCVLVHYPWRDKWTTDPPHMLDPYLFTTHQFDLWE